ncbi:hypothetical protein A9Q81_03695 [Gammaproteobacteria bacterium 42_54_T18]|nr:hypothetical protein A9Q81_03695 [Gammaproteobacteria bacterium 42_54_T18]
MIDTHCHLDFPVFDHDRALILKQAQGYGFESIIVPAVVQKDWPRVIDLCERNNLITLNFALGLHPCFMNQHASVDEAEVALNEAIVRSMIGVKNSEKEGDAVETIGGRLVAVGEIGLDYFIDSPEGNRQKQLALFSMQLSVAKKHNLPVLLHVRKAHDEVLKCLRRERLEKGGIVHAFSGSEQQASQYCELGFVLGIGGSATYDRAKKLARIIRQTSVESLVLETDAPDIPPAFARGERNTPLNLPRIAQAIAEIRGMDAAVFIQQTSINAKRVLGL